MGSDKIKDAVVQMQGIEQFIQTQHPSQIEAQGILQRESMRLRDQLHLTNKECRQAIKVLQGSHLKPENPTIPIITFGSGACELALTPAAINSIIKTQREEQLEQDRRNYSKNWKYDPVAEAEAEELFDDPHKCNLMVHYIFERTGRGDQYTSPLLDAEKSQIAGGIKQWDPAYEQRVHAQQRLRRQQLQDERERNRLHHED